MARAGDDCGLLRPGVLRRSAFPLIALTIAWLALSPGALARGPIVLAPPGDSAVSQYVEIVPTDSGGGIPRAPGQQGGALTPGQRRAYERLGADGRMLVAVVDATSPESVSGKPPGEAGAGRTAYGSDNGSGAGSGLSSGPFSGAHVPSVGHLILDAAAGGGNGGLGVLLPALVIASALFVIVVAIWRRQARPSP